MASWTPDDVRRVVERAVDRVLAGASSCGCPEPAACACGGLSHEAQGEHTAHAAHSPAPHTPHIETAVVHGLPASASAMPAARPARVLDWTRPGLGDARPVTERVPAAPGRASRAPEAIDPKRTIAIGGDHGGFALKEVIKKFLRDELRYAVLDLGTHSSNEPVDYPDVAREVASAVAEGRAFRGVVVDAAGIGSTMAANRVPGARCALCHDMKTVINSRAHNDANVLALGSTVVHVGLARQMITTWLKTPFEGGRHARRVAKIMELERLRPSPERTS